MNNTRGFTLVIGLMFLLIVLLLAATRLIFSREHLNQVAHLSEHEQAWQAAAGSLAAGQQLIDETLRYLNNNSLAANQRITNAPTPIKELLKNLLDEKGLIRRDGFETTLAIPELKPFFSSIENFNSATLQLKLSPAQPIFTDNQEQNSRDNFLAMDPNEFSITFSLHAETAVGNAHARAIFFREFRQVNILPSILGKFVLTLNQPPSETINQILDSNDQNRMKGRPIVISCGKSQDSSQRIAGEKVRDLIDEQGWIYLGGNDAWQFNLSLGGNNDEAMDSLLAEQYSLNDIPSGESFSRGGNLSYYALRKHCHRELGSSEEGQALTLRSVRDYAYSSLLNLTGSMKETTPTIVIGKAYRSWCLIQGLYNQSQGTMAPFPFLTQSHFSGNNWPGNLSQRAISAIRDNFSSDFTAYQKRMSTIATEKFNIGNLEITDLKLPEEAIPLMLEPRELPAGTPLPPPLNRIKKEGNSTQYFENITGLFSLLDDQEKVLFTGTNPLKIVNSVYFKQKSGWNFADSKSLFKQLFKSNQESQNLSGIHYLSTNLVLTKPLKIAKGGGGILLVDGDVLLDADITTTDNEPFTIISLSGNITLANSRKIAAGIIALKGNIQLPEQFSITGILAANSLIFPKKKSNTIRTLTWNPAFDPTNHQNYSKQYRIMGSEEWKNASP
jgi:hypothetical protein